MSVERHGDVRLDAVSCHTADPGSAHAGFVLNVLDGIPHFGLGLLGLAREAISLLPVTAPIDSWVLPSNSLASALMRPAVAPRGMALRVRAPEAWAGATKAGVAISISRLKTRPRQVAASWRTK